MEMDFGGRTFGTGTIISLSAEIYIINLRDAAKLDRIYDGGRVSPIYHGSTESLDLSQLVVNLQQQCQQCSLFMLKA